MTKSEYEDKISKLAGMLQDFESTIEALKDDFRQIVSLVDYLPDLSDLEDNDNESD